MLEMSLHLPSFTSDSHSCPMYYKVFLLVYGMINGSILFSYIIKNLTREKLVVFQSNFNEGQIYTRYAIRSITRYAQKYGPLNYMQIVHENHRFEPQMISNMEHCSCGSDKKFISEPGIYVLVCGSIHPINSILTLMLMAPRRSTLFDSDSRQTFEMLPRKSICLMRCA